MVTKEFGKTKKPSRLESEEEEVEELTEVKDVEAHQLKQCHKLIAISKTNIISTPSITSITSLNTSYQAKATARLQTSSSFRKEEDSPPDTWARMV
jgi:hypothetical protein